MTWCSCDWATPNLNERLLEVMRLLRHSAKYVDQTEGRSGINGQVHALRCAALGRDRGHHIDSAFIGLVHDLARPLNDVHHGEIIAEIVRDRVTESAYHILRTHGSYQAAIVHDTAFPEDTWSKDAKQLAAFEVLSFSPKYAGPTMSPAEATALLKNYLG